jgi:hypothetical protein
MRVLTDPHGISTWNLRSLSSEPLDPPPLPTVRKQFRILILPQPTPSQTTETDLVMDEILVTTTQEDTIPTVTPKPDDQQESSSVEKLKSPTASPQWDVYQQEITPVDLWLAPITPLTQPNYLHRHCSICESAMETLDPHAILTATTVNSG